MSLGTFLTALRLPHLLAQWQILREMGPFLRFHFLYAALDCGLLSALRTPASRDELVERLNVQRPDLLYGIIARAR